jgi:hypothetical protein
MAILWLKSSDTVAPSGVYTADAIATASLILYKLSGEKFAGVQTTTESYGSGLYSPMQMEPVVVQGSIRNIPLQAGLRELRLRNSPVVSVQSITHAGVLMDPSEYSLRNNAYVVRANSVPWILDPLYDLTVSYTYGSAIPAAGKRAALRLANELIWASEDSSECSLPQRITTQITRQGESMTVLDPLNFLQAGRTGVYEVDLFLAAVNPNKAKKKSRVFSVDKPRGERIN